MIELGIYRTQDGKDYDCLFHPEEELAEAIGPLPEPGQTGARGAKFKVRARSKEEAKEGLAAKMGPGTWWPAKT